MEYVDIDNNPIKQGFYVETFYKNNDEFRNRIVWITSFQKRKSLYLVVNQTTPIKLNSNYLRWLRPIEQEVPKLEKLLLLRDFDSRCGEGTDLMMDNNGVNNSGLPPVPKLVKLDQGAQLEQTVRKGSDCMIMDCDENFEIDKKYL